MPTKKDIQKLILQIAGDPSVGSIYTYSEKWADAIWKLYNPETNEDVTLNEEGEPDSDTSVGVAKRETRITKPTEKR